MSNVPHIFDSFTKILAAPVNENFKYTQDEIDAINNVLATNVAGFNFKTAVVAATTGNIALTGNQTIDGIAITAGMRVLVWQQTNATQNGIYVSATGAWSRASDMSTWASCIAATVVSTSGNTNTGVQFACTVVAGGIIGVNNITFIKFFTNTGFVENTINATHTGIAPSGAAVAAAFTNLNTTNELIYTPETLGAGGNGIANDTAYVQTLANNTSKLNVLGLKYFCNATVALAYNVNLQGLALHPEGPAQGGSLYSNNSLITTSAAVGVSLNRASALSNLSVVKSGLIPIPNSQSDCMTNLAAYAGTGITANYLGGKLENLYIAGFTNAVIADQSAPAGGTSTDGGRVIISNLNIDCTNGVTLKNSRDVSHINSLHLWPFTTELVPGRTYLAEQRSGTALTLQNFDEFTVINDFFSYGYYKGILIDGCNTQYFTSAQIDYTNPNTNNDCGVEIINNSWGITFIDLHTEATRTGIRLNSTNTVERSLIVEKGRIIGTDYSINIIRGSAYIDGTVFEASGTAAINLGPNAGNVDILNCIFTGTAYAITIDPSYSGICKIDLSTAQGGTPTFNIPIALLQSGNVLLNDPFNYTNLGSYAKGFVRNLGKIKAGSAGYSAIETTGELCAASAGSQATVAFQVVNNPTGTINGDVYFDGRFLVARRMSDDGLTVLKSVTLADLL